MDDYFEDADPVAAEKASSAMIHLPFSISHSHTHQPLPAPATASAGAPAVGVYLYDVLWQRC